MGDTANIIITHQKAEEIDRMLEWWSMAAPLDSIWIAYGGKREEFARINFAQKYFLESNRIRTANPQRERQGYMEVYQKAITSGALEAKRYVHVAEYDQLPLQPAVNMLQIRVLQRLKADVLGYQLMRVDQTNNPHYLWHKNDPRFLEFFRSISRRPDKETVLSALGFGMFWTVEAFRAVTDVLEPFPIYLELFLPTVAHHLGFRVRRIDEPAKYNAVTGDSEPMADEATAAGVWNLHPVKSRWSTATTSS